MQSEKWKKFPLNNAYQVSTLGNVRSIDRVVKRADGTVIKLKGKEIKKQLWKGGYHFIATCRNSISRQYSIHRLVAITHIPNPKRLPQVNHKNGIKTDNRVENLEWCTMAYNNLHSYRTGLKKHHRCWLGKSGYNHNKSMEVIQYDENWNELRRFGSGRECMKQIGNFSIWYYVTNKKLHNGKYYAYALKRKQHEPRI